MENFVSENNIMQALSTLFPSFSSDLLDEINSKSTLKSFKKGDSILRTGQYIKSTILVLNGQIKVYREGEDGGDFFMYYLQAGQACAVSVITSDMNDKSGIKAKVIEDTDILVIPIELMNRWMRDHASWFDFVLETYRSRFEEVLSVIDHVAFNAMDQQLEFYLNRQAKATGKSDLKISHQEIANDLNSSREVISRLLKRMEQLGKVKLYRSHIELI